jgi:hypothetical protein
VAVETGNLTLSFPFGPTLEFPMLKHLHLKLFASAGLVTALVAVLEAGGKWH